MGRNYLTLVLEAIEVVLVSFFILMTVIGLSEPLALRGISPVSIQIAGVLLVGFLVVKFIRSVRSSLNERSND